MDAEEIAEELAMVCDAYGLPHSAVALARHIENNRAETTAVWKMLAEDLQRRIDALNPTPRPAANHCPCGQSSGSHTRREGVG